MHASLEPDVNGRVEREKQYWKQLSPHVSTDEGIQIDESDSQEWNAQSPIDAT
jgi:hypothetical protein